MALDASGVSGDCERTVMSDEKPNPKYGTGHASAMARLGLAELRAAVVFSESNVVQPSLYGIYGTKTPGEVQNERQSSSKDQGDDVAPPLTQQRELDHDQGSEDKHREHPEMERE